MACLCSSPSRFGGGRHPPSVAINTRMFRHLICNKIRQPRIYPRCFRNSLAWTTPLKWHSVKRQTVRLFVNDTCDQMIPEATLGKNYWAALGSAKVLEGEGVKLTNGESYRYQVLSVAARSPYLEDLEDATFVVRDCYPKIWEILEPELGRQFKFLLRGSPGIGKSVAFARGYLLYQLRKTMMNDTDQRVQNVVCTDPSDGGYDGTVYSRDGTVRTFERSSPRQVRFEIDQLCKAATTVWIQDDKHHGPSLALCRGLVILVASPKRDNYNRFIKLISRRCWIPMWDFHELSALAYTCYRHITQEELKLRIKYGTFPRQILTKTEQAYRENVQESLLESLSLTVTEALHTLASVETKLGQDAVSQRIIYTHVDRDTLQPNGSALVPAYFDILLEKRANATVDDVAKLIEAQLRLTGDRQAAGKQFERLLLYDLDKGSRVLQCRKLTRPEIGVPTSKKAKSPETSEKKLFHTCEYDVKLPALQYVRSLLHYDVSLPCFYASQKDNEKGVDAVYISPDEIIAMQSTLNKDHKRSGDQIYPIFEHALKYFNLKQEKEPKLTYALLTDYETGLMMFAKDLSSKTKSKNEVLAKVGQVVLTPDPKTFFPLSNLLKNMMS